MGYFEHLVCETSDDPWGSKDMKFYLRLPANTLCEYIKYQVALASSFNV